MVHKTKRAAAIPDLTDFLDPRYVLKAGDTMTGLLILERAFATQPALRTRLSTDTNFRGQLFPRVTLGDALDNAMAWYDEAGGSLDFLFGRASANRVQWRAATVDIIPFLDDALEVYNQAIISPKVANPTFRIKDVGRLEWGAGGAAAVDVNLFRQAADILRTEDRFQALVGSGIGVPAIETLVSGELFPRIQLIHSPTGGQAGIEFGDGTGSPDTIIFRAAGPVIAFNVNLDFSLLQARNIIIHTTVVDPPAGMPGRFYTRTDLLRLSWDDGTAIKRLAHTDDLPVAHGAASHSGDVIPGANQDFGAFFSDFAQIAAPANPAAGVRRLFVDSATGKMSVRTSAGATVSLEESGGAGALIGQAAGEVYLSLAKTNIGTAYIAIYMAAFSEENQMIIDFTNVTDVRIIYLWDYVGVGTQQLRWVDAANNANVLREEPTFTTDRDPGDSGWFALPAAISGVKTIEWQGKSTTGTDDPIAKGYKIMTR